MALKKSSKPRPAPAAKAAGLAAVPHVWLDAILKPAAMFEVEKTRPGWGPALMNFAIAGALGGLMAGLLYSGLLAAFVPAAGAVSFALLTGVGAIASIAGSLLVTLVFFIFAKALGGKGGFRSLYYCTSLYALAPWRLPISRLA